GASLSPCVSRDTPRPGGRRQGLWINPFFQVKLARCCFFLILLCRILRHPPPNTAQGLTTGAMSDRYTFKDHALERQLFLSRLLVGGIVALCFILVLIARLVYLQVDQHEYYSTKSDNYRIHLQPVP